MPCHWVRPDMEDLVIDKMLESGIATIMPEDMIPLVPFQRRSNETFSVQRNIRTCEHNLYYLLSAEAASGGIIRYYQVVYEDACYFRPAPEELLRAQVIWIRVPSGASLHDLF